MITEPMMELVTEPMMELVTEPTTEPNGTDGNGTDDGTTMVTGNSTRRWWL
ncbi:hypothetical protein [Dolosigranulum savutiense]|uniref:Uncharacterized protein n=1 Tax=Dolosigranulum savutiense TaxID=3110288 RepID=A0AB74TS94_9LACT